MKYLIIPFFIFLNLEVYSQTKTFIREFTYNASDIDSKISSRAIATKELKSLLLNEIGTYIESESILTTSEVGESFSQNFKENITTITAGVTKLEVIDERWDGKTFWMKASITIDQKELRESLKQLINDRQKLKELVEVKQKLRLAEMEISNINKQLQESKAKDLEALSKKYNEEIKKITAIEFFENGYEKMIAKNYESAIVDFSMGLKIDSNMVEAYINRGVSYDRLGKTTEAISDLAKAIKLNPEYPEPYLWRGISIQKQGNFYKAIENFETAIRLNPDYSEAYFFLGFTQNRIGMNSDAIYNLTKAIEIKPNANHYFSRGNTYLDLGNYNEAINDYTNAIKLNLDNEYVYLQRGVAYSYLGRNEEALIDYSTHIKFNPGDYDGYANRGYAYFFLENYIEAVKDFTAAIKIEPTETEYVYRGQCYIQLDNYASAISDFAKAIAINPSCSFCYYYKGNAHLLLNQFEEGCLNFEKALELGYKEARVSLEDFCY